MIKLADTLAPMADFPAVEAKDVAFNDNKTLQEKYDNGELGGGGTSVTVDTSMSSTSTNPVQNKVIKKYIDDKEINVSAEVDNAIEEKDDGLYVENKTEEINSINEKLNKIKKYQKYVNTDLDYIYVSIQDTHANEVLSEKGDRIPFDKVICSNNISINNDYSVPLKAGKTYEISADFWSGISPNSGIRLDINDITNNINISRFYKSNGTPSLGIGGTDFKSDYNNNGEVIYTPTTDCDIAVIVSDFTSGGVKIPGQVDNLITNYLSVKEIGRAITIDPLEYVDSTKGIEDTPVGHIISYMGNNAPKHYLICDGGEYNIVDYPHLAQHFTNEFGSVNYFGGDGINTFCVPDLRGEFLRGTGTAIRDTGSGANVGEHQDATTHINMTLINSGSDKLIQTYPKSSGGIAISNYDKLNDNSSLWMNFYQGAMGSFTNGKGTYTSRPTNTSVLYCIKYEPTYFMKNTYSADSVYSTDEMIIGRWIDGKPLYRKVIQGNITSKDQSLFVVNENVKTMISIYGYDSPDGIYYFPFNYTQNGSTQRAIFYKKDTDTIEFRSNSYNSGEVFVVILEYTKTTD